VGVKDYVRIKRAEDFGRIGSFVIEHLLQPFLLRSLPRPASGERPTHNGCQRLLLLGRNAGDHSAQLRTNSGV